MIRNVRQTDAKPLVDIYNYYVKNTVVTFDLETISKTDMQANIKSVTAKYPWLVYEIEGAIAGYAYAAQWKKRKAYDSTVETTVYLHPDFVGKKIGTALYKELLAIVKSQGYHLAIGGISLPNAASVALHEKFGFIKAAHYHQVGFKFNQWIDVGYWELILK